MTLWRLVGATAAAGAVLLPLILGISVGSIILGAAVGAIAAAGQYAIWRDSWAPTRGSASDTGALGDDTATRRLGFGALVSSLLVIVVLAVVWLTNGHRVSPFSLFLLAPPAYLAGVYAWRRYGESEGGRGPR